MKTNLKSAEIIDKIAAVSYEIAEFTSTSPPPNFETSHLLMESFDVAETTLHTDVTFSNTPVYDSLPLPYMGMIPVIFHKFMGFCWNPVNLWEIYKTHAHIRLRGLMNRQGVST